VGVTFDEQAGSHCGSPIMGIWTFPGLVHVFGGSGRPFSAMSLEEIWEVRPKECRNQEEWVSRSDPLNGELAIGDIADPGEDGLRPFIRRHYSRWSLF
jgi:hypothetical protein